MITRRIRQGAYVFPAEGSLAALAENVRHGVQSREEDSLFGGATTDVDTGGRRVWDIIEEK